jgi:ribulose-phosphate 3-epimerase
VKGIIAPSLLSFNHAEMRPRVVELVKAGAEVIHIDIMDGQFVPPISFGDSMVKGFSDIEGPLYEAHLMVKRPENQFERFAEAGCGRILFHAEATSHSHRLIQVLHEMNVEAGISRSMAASMIARFRLPEPPGRISLWWEAISCATPR